MNKSVLSVPAISCGHCVKTIEMELGELEGVSRVAASADTKLVEVEFESPATEISIIERLAEINYPAAQGL